MEVRVDPEVCIGSAMCAEIAPGVFEIDDDNVARVVDPSGAPPEDIREAEGACPVAAIAVEEDGA